MLSHHGLKRSKKRKSNSVTTNSKVKKISNILETQAIEDYKSETEPEFKIHSGVHEYNVKRLSGVFVVKPCSFGSTGLLTKKSSTVVMKSSKTEEERPPKKLSTSVVGYKSQKTNLNSHGKCISHETNPIQRASTHHSMTKYIMKEDQNTSNTNKKCRELLNLVHQAIKMQKIFSIGNSRRAFSPIRKALKARGWIEKCSAEVLVEEDTHTKTSEIINRLLKECDANFIWVINSIDFGSVRDSTIVSRFPKSNHFTTKVGLCSFLDEFHWFYEPNISKAVAPRTFKIVTEEDIDNFIKEFGLTACVALLKIIVNQVTTAESDHFFRNGKVPVSVVDFANAQCSEYIQHRQHDDIDRQESSPTTAKDWTDFLTWFSRLAHEDEKFQTTSYPMIQALYTMSKITLKNIEPYWPLFEVEGWKNLWVVKPAAEFCGRGVKVMRNLEDIICNVEAATDFRMGRHIVQKYIERPLLIYNTKFDIRQWFLVTSVYPLTIWFYK
ncbi:Protein monoglycylase ttll8 [Homalodisca vitripennis]|nr:Protein monoglycylase ttll8 [Homalodisca vitripennis]